MMVQNSNFAATQTFLFNYNIYFGIIDAEGCLMRPKLLSDHYSL